MTGEESSLFQRSFCVFPPPTERKPVFNFMIQVIALNIYCKQTDFSLGRTLSIL